MARTFKEFLDVFVHGRTVEDQMMMDLKKVTPSKLVSSHRRIKERDLPPVVGPIRTGKLPGRDIATTPIDELSAGELDEFSRVFDAREVPVPTDISGARKIDVPTDITGATELLTGGGTTPSVGQAPGRGFDWPKFIETAGRLGAALAPRGVFAEAGLEAAAMVGEEREREVARAKGAEDLRRFEIETKLKKVDDALNQAKFDYQQTQDTGALTKAIKLEQEKNRLRIELETAKQPAKAAKAKKIEDKAERARGQQRKNRIRTAKNSVMSAIRRHDKGTEDIPQFIGLTPEQVTRVMEIIRKMDITGDETTDELIQRAVDLLGIETGISGHAEVSASELLGPDEEGTNFITNEELLRGVR